MKIDSQELKSLYQSHVRSREPASREGCPPVEQLVKTLRSQASRKKAATVADHISSCGDCAREWGFLVEVLRSEKEFIQGVQERLGASQRTEGRGLFMARFSWGLASLLVGFIIVGILVLKFVVRPAPETYRASLPAGIELVQPTGGISFSSLVFKWKPVPNTEFYTLEVFDEALTSIWKSGLTVDNSFASPEELRRKLNPGKTYFWQVTAVLRDGEKFHSSLGEFIAKE